MQCLIGTARDMLIWSVGLADLYSSESSFQLVPYFSINPCSSVELTGEACKIIIIIFYENRRKKETHLYKHH